MKITLTFLSLKMQLLVIFTINTQTISSTSRRYLQCDHNQLMVVLWLTKCFQGPILLSCIILSGRNVVLSIITWGFQLLLEVINYYLRLSIITWGYQLLLEVINYYLRLSIITWGYQLLLEVINYYLRLSIITWGYQLLLEVINYYLRLSIITWGYQLLLEVICRYCGPLTSSTHYLYIYIYIYIYIYKSCIIS